MTTENKEYNDWINMYGLIMQKINPRTAKILEFISLNNTINISEIAKKMKLPITTVYGILHRLITNHIILIRYLINISALGLTQYSVIFHYNKMEDIKKILMANEYWTYYAKGYCGSPCAYVKYVIPIGHNQDFIEFLNTAKEIGLVNDYEAYATTSSYIPPVCFDDFDFKKRTWNFNWVQLLNNIYSAEPKNDKYLSVRTIPKIKLDSIDLKILLRREVNAFISLSSIQRMFNNVSLQSIYYHYKNHVLKRNLMGNIKLVFLPYPYTFNGKIVSDSMMFFITFKNTIWMNKFVNALKSKIFIGNITRVFGENTLLIYVYLPRTETAEFLNLLDKLVEDDSIIKYRFFTIDIRTALTESIPYSAYDTHEGTWRWDQQRYLLKLQESIKIAPQNDKKLIPLR